jgi:hypothetical protein
VLVEQCKNPFSTRRWLDNFPAKRQILSMPPRPRRAGHGFT